ncbi:MAG: iron-sulfur cluster assembly scaffold protein [Pseudomonadota bacterium]
MSADTAPSTPKLYSPRLLALSAELANFPFDETLPLVSEARSRTCGSTITLGIAIDNRGAVSRIGMQVAACAVGQSSAAILARGIDGVDEAALNGTVEAINAWLKGSGDMPEWPEFDALAAARSHPGRHGALLLPWKAAMQALSSQSPSG